MPVTCPETKYLEKLLPYLRPTQENSASPGDTLELILDEWRKHLPTPIWTTRSSAFRKRQANMRNNPDTADIMKLVEKAASEGARGGAAAR